MLRVSIGFVCDGITGGGERNLQYPKGGEKKKPKKERCELKVPYTNYKDKAEKREVEVIRKIKLRMGIGNMSNTGGKKTELFHKTNF